MRQVIFTKANTFSAPSSWFLVVPKTLDGVFVFVPRKHIKLKTKRAMLCCKLDDVILAIAALLKQRMQLATVLNSRREALLRWVSNNLSWMYRNLDSLPCSVTCLSQTLNIEEPYYGENLHQNELRAITLN